MPFQNKSFFTLWIRVQCRTIFREENWIFPVKAVPLKWERDWECFYVLSVSSKGIHKVLPRIH